MYSVVLLAAMTAGGQTPDWHGCRTCGDSYGNCYGSCYGNYGIDSWGSCWGSCNGCWGAYGSCSGLYPWDWSSVGCNGCLGADAAVMSPYFVQPPAVVAPPGAEPGEPLHPPAKVDDKNPETLAPHRARLIVDLPADAKLFVDDTAMKTPSGHRTYQTPDLESGQTYFYDLRVEMERDGKIVRETKRVVVKAGDEARADFTDLASTTTAAAK